MSKTSAILGHYPAKRPCKNPFSDLHLLYCYMLYYFKEFKMQSNLPTASWIIHLTSQWGAFSLVHPMINTRFTILILPKHILLVMITSAFRELYMLMIMMVRKKGIYCVYHFEQCLRVCPDSGAAFFGGRI